MENRKRFKFAVVIVVLIIAILYFTVPTINSYGLGIMDLPKDGINNIFIGRHNPLKMPDATFYKSVSRDSLYVKFEDYLLSIYGMSFADSKLVETGTINDYIKYKFRPEFYQDKFILQLNTNVNPNNLIV